MLANLSVGPLVWASCPGDKGIQAFSGLTVANGLVHTQVLIPGPTFRRFCEVRKLSNH